MLKNKDSRANYPEAMRRVRALVEVDGKEREMEFLTNNVSLERHQCRLISYRLPLANRGVL